MCIVHNTVSLTLNLCLSLGGSALPGLCTDSSFSLATYCGDLPYVALPHGSVQMCNLHMCNLYTLPTFGQGEVSVVFSSFGIGGDMVMAEKRWKFSPKALFPGVVQQLRPSPE